MTSVHTDYFNYALELEADDPGREYVEILRTYVGVFFFTFILGAAGQIVYLSSFLLQFGADTSFICLLLCNVGFASPSGDGGKTILLPLLLHRKMPRRN